jgi:hypothetical protein
MATKPEISQRYPKNIELDEGQMPAGLSTLPVCPCARSLLGVAP